MTDEGQHANPETLGEIESALGSGVRHELEELLRESRNGDGHGIGITALEIMRALTRLQRVKPDTYPIIAAGVSASVPKRLAFQLVVRGEARVVTLSFSEIREVQRRIRGLSNESQ